MSEVKEAKFKKKKSNKIIFLPLYIIILTIKYYYNRLFSFYKIIMLFFRVTLCKMNDDEENI